MTIVENTVGDEPTLSQPAEEIRLAGKVLTGLTRRIVPDATAVAAGTPEDVAALAAALVGSEAG